MLWITQILLFFLHWVFILVLISTFTFNNHFLTLLFLEPISFDFAYSLYNLWFGAKFAPWFQVLFFLFLPASYILKYCTNTVLLFSLVASQDFVHIIQTNIFILVVVFTVSQSAISLTIIRCITYSIVFNELYIETFIIFYSMFTCQANVLVIFYLKNLEKIKEMIWIYILKKILCSYK